MKSTAVQYNEEVFEGLQLNIFSQDSRHFDIVSEVICSCSANSFGVHTKHVHQEDTCIHLPSSDHNCLGAKFVSLLQNGDISYHLHKVRTFSPFAASEWQLSDGSKTSPGTIIIRKSPFAGHVTFERKDGTLIADMGTRLLMIGSEFCWGGKVYRYYAARCVHALLLVLSKYKTTDCHKALVILLTLAISQSLAATAV